MDARFSLPAAARRLADAMKPPTVAIVLATLLAAALLTGCAPKPDRLGMLAAPSAGPDPTFYEGGPDVMFGLGHGYRLTAPVESAESASPDRSGTLAYPEEVSP